MLTKLYRFQQKFAQIKAKTLKNFQNFERQPTYKTEMIQTHSQNTKLFICSYMKISSICGRLHNVNKYAAPDVKINPLAN